MYKEMIDQMLELRLYDMQESDITNYDDSAVSDIEITTLHRVILQHSEMLTVAITE